MTTIKTYDSPVIYGSVSQGTLLTADLLPAFLSALRSVAPAHYEQLVYTPFFGFIPAYADDDPNHPWWDSEEAGDRLDDLFNLLDEHAPSGYYFGAHEGDGTDFGFWPIDTP